MSTRDRTAGEAEDRAIYRRYLSASALHAQASARACGLGATDLYALNILELGSAMTPGELSARTGLTTGPTTRLIDRLEQAGYVRRIPDPGDRRKVVVVPIGQPPELERVVAPARRAVGEIISSYPPEHRAVLFDYFARATTAYQQAVAEIRENQP